SSATGTRTSTNCLAMLAFGTRSSHDCSAGTFANFGSQRTPEIIKLPVSLWFGSSPPNKLRNRANFRTATLPIHALSEGLRKGVRYRAPCQAQDNPGQGLI